MMMFHGKEVKVNKAYNGKEGCMCGCRGNYAYDDSRAVASRVKKIESFVGPMRPDAANYGDCATYSTEAFGGDCYVYVREGDRVTCVYFEG